jgi:hypothetical protein
MGNSEYAGGVSDGTYGATAFEYNQLNVAAKKAWFFFDDEFVALGAGIDGPNANYTVITTLNQTLQNGQVTYAATAGAVQSIGAGTVTRTDLDWVHHDGVGYLFLSTPASATLQAVSQSGSWYSINTQYSNETVTRDVFSLQVNHGTRPNGATYAYAVVPDVDTGQMASYAADVPLTVLANTSQLQAVRHNGLGLTQAAFYTAGSLQVDSRLSVEVRDPILLMIDDRSEGLKLSAANPLAEAMTLRADIRRAAPGGGEEFARITMRLPGGDEAGKSVVRTIDNPVLSTDVARFRQRVAGASSLIHHYTFEGQNLAERLQDKVTAGGVNLQQMAYGSAGDVDDIVYAFGLDHSTTAISPQRLSASGAALASVANVSLPTSLTVEALIRPEFIEIDGGQGYGIMAGGPTGSKRGYFLTNSKATQTIPWPRSSATATPSRTTGARFSGR